MRRIEDCGGPAFPHVMNECEPQSIALGMSVRDYFAIHAPEPDKTDVEFWLSRDHARNPHNDSYKPKIRSLVEIRAHLRYEYADAMLAERAA